MADRSDPPVPEPPSEDVFARLQSHWLAGRRVPVEHFLLHHPDLSADPETVMGLVLLEVSLREDLGEFVSHAELVSRFPDLDAPLRLQRAFQDGLQRSPAAHDSDNSPPDPGSGFLISGYEIVREIGRGGMGTVYEARQLSLGRSVALKTLTLGPRAGGHQLARFTTEADAVSRLQHPHVVQIFEIGAHNGLPFLALELVDGGTLADRLRGGPLAPRAAGALVETLARAVHSVHESGIVHRDLKPANVLFTRPADGAPHGVPKLSDFGLAKLLDGIAHPTQSGDTLGTPGYMAPEQVSGGREIGPPADVYGLGAVLYECLTGQPPFRGATVVETLFQIGQSDPLPPSRLRPGVPRDLQTIALKCLEKNPGRRYPTAAALADDLGRFLRGESVRARPLGPFGRVWRRARRRPLAAGLIAALIGTGLTGSAGVTWKWREAEWLAEAEARQRGTAETNLYRSRVAQAALLWRSNNLAAAKEHLTLCRPEAGRPDLRGWEWHYLNRLFNPEAATFSQRYWVRGIAVSPDGREVAVACGDPKIGKDSAPRGGELVVWDLGTRAPSWRTGADETVAVGYSPDGRFLAWADTSGTVRVADRATRQERFVWREAATGQFGLCFHPDSRQLAIFAGTPAGRVVIRDLETGAEIAARPHDGLVGWRPAPVYSPGGQSLVLSAPGDVLRMWSPSDSQERIVTTPVNVQAVAFIRPNRMVTGGNVGVIWDPETRQDLRRLVGHTGVICSAAVRPDRRAVATGGADHTVRLWDAETSQETMTLRGHTWTVQAVAFTPDGSRLLSGGQDRAVKEWDLTRDPRGRLLPFVGWTNAVAFTPDGRVRLSSSGGHTSGGQVRSWAVSDGRADRPVVLDNVTRVLDWPRCYAEFFPDGRRLLTISSDQRVPKVWDADTGRELVALSGHTRPVHAVAVSPDGRWAATAGWDTGPESQSCEVRVWDAGTGAERARFALPVPQIISLAFSPDGQRLAAGAATPAPGADAPVSVVLCDVAAQTLCWEATVHTGIVTGVTFSPDGQRVASVGRIDRQLCLLDAADGRVLHRRQTAHSPTCVTYHPSGRRLAVVGYEGVVSIRDGDDGTEVLQLPALIGNWKGDTASDARVRFSPDGTRLVSNNLDGSLSLWDGREMPAGAGQ